MTSPQTPERGDGHALNEWELARYNAAMRLSRELRWSPMTTDVPPINSWAGSSLGDRGEPTFTLRATVEGPVDPITGYLCDIKHVDELLRGHALPLLRDPLAEPGDFALAPRMIDAFARVAGHGLAVAKFVELELVVSPFLKLTVAAGAPTMVELTRSYEFAAAHRLAVPGWSDEDNRRTFGKCSNPHGHGHNYVVEVTVRGTPEADGLVAPLPLLDRVVRERVIEPFDHRNLNVECADFAALNPTVENIARAIWRRLDGTVSPARLVRVRVWETPKTFADCAGEE